MGGTLLNVPAKLWTVKPICFKLLLHFMRAAASRTFWTAGRSRPMRMAIIAMTTNNSIRVNPKRVRRPGHVGTLFLRGSGVEVWEEYEDCRHLPNLPVTRSP